VILVDARCTILPERRSDFVREVREIIPLVRREAGCIRYEFMADVGDAEVFHFIEVWESQKHLDDHLVLPHMQEYFATTTPWHAAPTVLFIYETSSSRSITMSG